MLLPFSGKEVLISCFFDSVGFSEALWRFHPENIKGKITE